MRELLERMPDDASMDDILYELAVIASIQRGLDDIDHGRFITHEEVKRRLDRWLVTGGELNLSSPE